MRRCRDRRRERDSARGHHAARPRRGRAAARLLRAAFLGCLDDLAGDHPHGDHLIIASIGPYLHGGRKIIVVDPVQLARFTGGIAHTRIAVPFSDLGLAAQDALRSGKMTKREQGDQ